MTAAAIDALREQVAQASALFASLTPQEWAAESACAGWRVQDVACHMASVFQTIADPGSLESGSSADAEENAEVPVQARRDWTPQQVVEAYAEWSEKGVAALAGLQAPPMADMVVPLGNLGSHPMHILGNAIVFDHYCHLRHDIGAAVSRAAELPHDAAALNATAKWMLAGLPQMCAPALARCDQGVNLVLDGPGGGTWTIAPSGGTDRSDTDGGEALWAVAPGFDAALPTAVSTAHEFVSWATQRADWRTSGVSLSGPNSEAAARTLDAFNVI